MWRLVAAAGVDLPLRLWDDTEVGHGPFRLVLRHPWSARALLLPPTDLAAGEAYLRDDVDVEGDMVALLRAVSRLGTALSVVARARIARHALALPRPPSDPAPSERLARLVGRSHSRERDRAAVTHHYDVGNDFCRLFLDDDLVYSCAYWADGDMTLERAQRRKLDTVVRKLDLQPGERLLDVGCGWGSLVIHAARTRDVTAVGVTLSREQAALARERVAAAGLADRVEIRLCDYRDLDEPFDAISSIGMVEHVGSARLSAYFRRLHDLLAPGGLLLNHGITTGWRPEPRDLANEDATFIGRYVFPDGGLVPAWHTIRDAQAAGLELLDVQQLRPHYALTLREWVRRLEAHREAAIDAASVQAYRTWRAYMAGSVVGFESGDMGVVQVLLGRDARLPLDRGHMAPRRVPAVSDDRMPREQARAA